MTPLVFLHMSKAAGSSMMRALNRVYDGCTVRTLSGDPKELEAFQREPVERRHAVDVLYGHVTYELHESLRSPCRVLTLLRDPVERVVSLYYYIAREPKHRLHAIVSEMTLEAFIGHPWAPEADNDYVRRLNSIADAHLPVGAITERMAENARENLAHPRTVFGIVGRYEESMRLVRHELAWPDVPEQRLNATPDRPPVADLPASTVDAIREQNAHDVRLYEFATGLFEQRLATLADARPTSPRPPAGAPRAGR